jgi:hypothetical protein
MRMACKAAGPRSGRGAAAMLALLVGAPAALVAAGPARATTDTFRAIGAAQTWTVPPGINRATFTLDGARGGSTGSGSSVGGLGGRAIATIALAPGETLQINVGGEGGDVVRGPGGYNGGGDDSPSCFSLTSHGTGGGASDVRRDVNPPDSTFALDERLLVAGGGGGAGASGDAGTGGAGGGIAGGDGGRGIEVASGGGGGTQTAGGAPAALGAPGPAGELGQGGGRSSACVATGGGGLWGGAGGGIDLGSVPFHHWVGFGGGGGGSGFTPDATGMTSGVSAGSGEVSITYSQPSVTIARAAGQADPANSGPVHFTADFSEPVSGFSAADVVLGGSAQPGSAVVTGPGPSYDVALSGMAADGTVTAAIGPGAAASLATTNTSTATAAGAVAAYDRTAPTVSIASPADGGTYRPGQRAIVSYSCLDAPNGSGAVSCVGDLAGSTPGTLPAGSLLPTGVASLGAHTFSVTATDRAGNATTATHSYRVSTRAGCTRLDIALMTVRRTGTRVEVTGIADRLLRGQNVQIRAGGAVVAHAVVRADGMFATSTKAPKANAVRSIGYSARVAALRSNTLRLTRHMTLTSARLAAGRVVLTGRLSPANRRRPAVRLLRRSRDCRPRFEVVGRSRVRRDGTFRVSFKPARGAVNASYRASTTLPDGTPTYTLPRAVRLRAAGP